MSVSAEGITFSKIHTEEGIIVRAAAPLIISASRVTDIPAFYGDWFLNRLKAGYSMRFNPFNGKAVYIDLSRLRAIVFWTKNIDPFFRHLDTIMKTDLSFYFQYSLNNYETEGFEPNMKPLDARISSFIRLSEIIGKKRLVWRFDPLVLSAQLNVDELLRRISLIGNELIHYTNKLVFSFADIQNYRGVRQRMEKNFPDWYGAGKINSAEFNMHQKLKLASGIKHLLCHWKEHNPDFTVASCCEDIDLSEFGIQHNKCIDDELLLTLCKDNDILNNYLRLQGKTGTLKDKGQRKHCGCIPSRDIGEYHTCPNFCTYCYANGSENTVKNNSLCHLLSGEGIIKGYPAKK